MDAEERARVAITITRDMLRRTVSSAIALIEMTTYQVGPDDVEDMVVDILGYLEKTKPVKPEEAEG